MTRTTTAAAALSLAALAVPASGQLSTTSYASGLSQPLYAGSPAGDGRLFVAEKGGRIQVVAAPGATPTTYLDLSDVVDSRSEGGLLGFAFAPDFATSGELYLNYTVTSDSTVVNNANTQSLDTVIERVTLTDPSAASAAAATRETVYRFTQPYLNHNAGWLGFAPGDDDGQFLYVPTGDGGSAFDPGNRAQDGSTPFGKILRLDVAGGDDFPSDPTRNYAVPADNAGGDGAGGLGEIVASGLRNPFRGGFDRLTGELYLGDVGQGDFEEQDVFDPSAGAYGAGVVGGANYGWRLREGPIATPNVGGPTPAGVRRPDLQLRARRFPRRLGRELREHRRRVRLPRRPARAGVRGASTSSATASRRRSSPSTPTPPTRRRPSRT